MWTPSVLSVWPGSGRSSWTIGGLCAQVMIVVATCDGGLVRKPGRDGTRRPTNVAFAPKRYSWLARVHATKPSPERCQRHGTYPIGQVVAQLAALDAVPKQRVASRRPLVNWSRILVTSATHDVSCHDSRLPPTPTTRMRGGPSNSAHFVAFVGLMVSPQTNAVNQMNTQPPMNHGAPPASSDRSSSHEVPNETMAASTVRRLAATRRLVGEYRVHRDRSPARVAKASTRLRTLTPGGRSRRSRASK